MNYSDDFDIGIRSVDVKKDKDFGVCRCLSFLVFVELNLFILSSMLDLLNGLGVVFVRSLFIFME